MEQFINTQLNKFTLSNISNILQTKKKSDILLENKNGNIVRVGIVVTPQNLIVTNSIF